MNMNPLFIIYAKFLHPPKIIHFDTLLKTPALLWFLGIVFSTPPENSGFSK